MNAVLLPSKIENYQYLFLLFITIRKSKIFLVHHHKKIHNDVDGHDKIINVMNAVLLPDWNLSIMLLLVHQHKKRKTFLFWQKGTCLTNIHCIGLYWFCIGFGQIIDFWKIKHLILMFWVFFSIGRALPPTTSLFSSFDDITSHHIIIHALTLKGRSLVVN